MPDRVFILKRAMQFMLANLDRPVDLGLVKEYNRIVCESLCDKPGKDYGNGL